MIERTERIKTWHYTQFGLCVHQQRCMLQCDNAPQRSVRPARIVCNNLHALQWHRQMVHATCSSVEQLSY